MSDNKQVGKVVLQAVADKPVIARDQPTTRILELVVTPPEMGNKKERAPLNLSLVLDRSGSMDGDKLHFVKQAAAHVVDLLSEKDLASITIYDDEVQTLFHTTLMTEQNKRRAKSSLQPVRTGGSTNLSGGWLKGCEEAAKGAMDLTINRALLLTDGQANVGICNIDELSTHARELFQRGISTSCFGVGMGYNEHMLESIANGGGGNFHFLETLSAIPLVFEREFEELINIALRDTEISIKLPPMVTGEVCGGWSSELEDGKWVISLGSLIAERKQSIYIKIHFEKGMNGDEVSFPMVVRGKGDGQQIYEATETVTFRLVSSEEEASMECDAQLMERFALVDMAEKANEALKRERAGDRAAASSLMETSIRENLAYMPSDVIDKYQFMKTQMSTGMSEDVRKRVHRQEYENRRGRERVRDYELRTVNGRLVAEIEGRLVLIASGRPVSVGKEKNWHFLNEIHPLALDHEGVTMGALNPMLGIHVDMLLGTDILHYYYVTIDTFRHRLNFSESPLLKAGVALQMDSTWGVKTPDCAVDGRSCRMIVDSGAKLSYIDHKTAAHFKPVGKENDFYPTVGPFETAVYEVPVRLGGLDLTLRCGVLPQTLESALFVRGKRGIIGSELFEKFVVTLAFPEKKILLQPVV